MPKEHERIEINFRAKLRASVEDHTLERWNAAYSWIFDYLLSSSEVKQQRLARMEGHGEIVRGLTFQSSQEWWLHLEFYLLDVLMADIRPCKCLRCRCSADSVHDRSPSVVQFITQPLSTEKAQVPSASFHQELNLKQYCFWCSNTKHIKNYATRNSLPWQL